MLNPPPENWTPQQAWAYALELQRCRGVVWISEIPGCAGVSGTEYILDLETLGFHCWVADAQPDRLRTMFPDLDTGEEASFNLLFAAYARTVRNCGPRSGKQCRLTYVATRQAS